MSEQHNVLLSQFLLLVVHEDHSCPVIWGWGMVFEVSDSPATWYLSLQDVPLMLLGRHGWLGVDDALLCCRCLLGGPMTLQAYPQSSTPTMASRALFSESGGEGGYSGRCCLYNAEPNPSPTPGPTPHGTGVRPSQAMRCPLPMHSNDCCGQCPCPSNMRRWFRRFLAIGTRPGRRWGGIRKYFGRVSRKGVGRQSGRGSL